MRIKLFIIEFSLYKYLFIILITSVRYIKNRRVEFSMWFDDYLNGRCFNCYEYLGAHVEKDSEGNNGVLFRVYAPMAKEIDVIGDFNNWSPFGSDMKKVDYRGLFELFIKGAKVGQKYKYHIHCCDDVWRDKADPVGFLMEKRPGTCSIIYDLKGYEYHDSKWIANRDRNFDKPVSIYEMHFGSWRSTKGNYVPSYTGSIDPLIKYLTEMGYTHVEFMPLVSYPFIGSWGYQDTGYFAIDSTFGEPKDLMKLVDALHQAGIGVIFDFVPVHFAIDAYGLTKFDGSCVYEYNNDLEYSQWGSKNFDLGKDPVRSFLISSVDLFCKLFHADGIRIDAVSNIIYYEGNTDRGSNVGGIEFVRRMNTHIHETYQSIMMIAEDSSSFSKVTKGTGDGLLFDYKWDLGWMNDTLKYYAKDPIYKKYCHNQMTFSMMYFYSENFLLPLSHDEVVHGKGTILNKMWGNYDQKFALARNLYAYQFAHPGKKLSFMGNELASFDEWDEKKGLGWNLLSYPKHIGFQRFIRDLNMIYRYHRAMYWHEYDPSRFQWIMVDNSAQSVLVFMRQVGDEYMVFIFNMTPNFYSYYDIGVPVGGKWCEILNSDKAIYGGFNQYNGTVLDAVPSPLQGQNYRVTIKLASFGAIYLTNINAQNANSEEVKKNTSLEGDDVVQTEINKDIRIISNKNKSIG